MDKTIIDLSMDKKMDKYTGSTLTYSIFNPITDIILPDGKKYYDEVNYRNIEYLSYFRKNSAKEGWVEDLKSTNVFYSNYEKSSYIKSYSNPLAMYISNKSNLAKIISDESYSPLTISFRLYKNNIPKYLYNNWKPENNSLWFLKKASDNTFGGYDVLLFRNIFFYFGYTISFCYGLTPGYC